MAAIPETPAIGPDIERRIPLEAVVWTLVGASGVFMALRVWARTYTRIWGVDDIHMAACWLTFVATAILITMIAESGGTRHFAYMTLEEKQHQVKLDIVLTVFAIPCTAFGKLAVAFTILRIVNQATRWQVWVLWALIVLVSVVTAVDTLLVLFRCGTPTHLWDLAGQATGAVACLDADAVYNYNTFTASFQTFADYFLALLPVHIIWRLQVPRGRRVALICLLGLSTFPGIAASIKTSLASRNLGVAADPTWDLFPLCIWGSIEVTLIVMCGSVPAIVPLWDRFFGRRKRGGYTSAGAHYAVSDFKPRAASKHASRTTMSRASQAGTELYHDTHGPAASAENSDVELARLTETHMRVFP